MKKLELGEEYPPKGEEKDIEKINRLIEGFMRKQYEASENRPAKRCVHSKSPGCLKGSFVILEDIPIQAKTGLFKQPGIYECWLRYSNGSQFIRHDNKPDVRGLSIKVMGVQGEKIMEEKKDALTQDFMFLNSKNFPVGNLKDFARFTKWFLTKNFTYGYPIGFILRRWLQMVSLIKNIRRKVLNPLAVPFYSSTAYKWGDHAVKYCLYPALPITMASIDTSKTDYLQMAIKDTLKKGSVSFDFMLQFQKDPYKMPVEDSSVVWDEKVSPFIKVGSVIIPDQDFTSSKHQEYCENLSFSTWHSLPEHRPLGGTNRSHRSSYLISSGLRHEFNGTEDIEPGGFVEYDQFMQGNE